MKCYASVSYGIKQRKKRRGRPNFLNNIRTTLAQKKALGLFSEGTSTLKT